ncbi:hypothetical protein BHE74_00003048, partial [Ensete ventricosum]
MQNNVLELWSLFDFLMPGFLGTERQVSCVIILCNSVTYLRLDGSVEPEKRYEIVKAFNSDPTIDVLLLTTHARFVIPVYTGILSLSRYGTLSGTE